jgi:hypothetical protein
MPVWTLARELGVSSQAILDKCAQEGWHVTSHSQTLTADQVARLRTLFPNPALCVATGAGPTQRAGTTRRGRDCGHPASKLRWCVRTKHISYAYRTVEESFRSTNFDAWPRLSGPGIHSRRHELNSLGDSRTLLSNGAFFRVPTGEAVRTRYEIT